MGFSAINPDGVRYHHGKGRAYHQATGLYIIRRSRYIIRPKVCISSTACRCIKGTRVFVRCTNILRFATGEQAHRWLSLECEPKDYRVCRSGFNPYKLLTKCLRLSDLLAWQYTAKGGMHSLLISPLAKADSASYMSEFASKIQFQNKKPTTRVGSLFWQRN